MTWVLILILVGGGTVAAPQKDHESCLKGIAQATLQSSVKVAYCVWANPKETLK